MRLRAWELCWLALDAASAPANHLPDIADSQGWQPELLEQLRTTPGLPKLNTRTWQELRRARDQQLFATLPPQGSIAAEPVANEALAALLTEGFAHVDLEQLRAWITPSVTAAITRWLSAGLLAMDALALSDDTTDATAVGLVAFVQATLEREHGAAAAAVDLVQSEPVLSAAVSDRRVPEAPREEEPAAAPAPQPAADPAPTAIAAEAAAPSAREPAAAIEQPASSSVQKPRHFDAPRAATSPRRIRPLAIAQIAGAVAIAAVLLLMLRSGSAPQPDATQPMNEVKPRALEPAPAAHVAPAQPPVVEAVPSTKAAKPTAAPQRSAKQQTSTANQRPRYRNLAAAKRAHTSKKIDDAAYTAAVAELEALRNARIAREQNALRSGKLTQTDYQRKVDAINKTLGFDSH